MKRGNVIHTLLFTILPVVFIISCASDEEKQPTPEVLTAQQAFELVQKIKDAFQNNDLEHVRSACSESLFQDLSSSRKQFKDIQFDFFMKWVDIEEDGTIHLYVSWNRTGKIGSLSKKKISDTGMGIFIIKNVPMQAMEILRENPFTP